MPWLSQMQRMEQATVKYTALAYWHQSCVGGNAILYQPFKDAISCYSAASWIIITFLVWSFAYSFSALFIMLTTFLQEGWMMVLILNFTTPTIQLV